MVTQVVDSLSGNALSAWQALMAASRLASDTDWDQTVLIWDADALIAAGSRKENLLKCIAVMPEFQGRDLTAIVLTQLRQEAFRAGCRHLFLYTKPQNRFLFQSLLFFPVAQTRDVLLMEDRENGIGEFLEGLPAHCGDGEVGAAVMNCDPFTLGHRHLIETAAKECRQVYVFVLSEAQGCFSPQDRLEMVRQGVRDLTNVTVVPTGPYLISQATFPTYFLKDRDRAEAIHCQLDVEIFRRYFLPRFGITRRYVGTEPFSSLTAQYNAALRENLPIPLREIPRLAVDGTAVSASLVRHLYAQEAWEAIAPLVPSSTYAFLRRKCHV